MPIQKIAFNGKTSAVITNKNRKFKNSQPKNKQSSKDDKLKKTLIAMGALAIAGIGVGVLMYKHNKNTVQKASETIKDVMQNNKVEQEIEQTSDGVIKKIELNGDDAIQTIKTEIIEIPEVAEPIIIPIQKKTAQVSKKNPWESARALFEKRVARSTQEFEERMEDGLRLSDRIKIIKHCNPDFEASKIRRAQMMLFSKEQINALNDNTLEHLLTNPDHANKKLTNMKFLKSLSPEKLIRIQESEDAMHKFYKIAEYNTGGYEFDCFAKFLTDL